MLVTYKGRQTALRFAIASAAMTMRLPKNVDVLVNSADYETLKSSDYVQKMIKSGTIVVDDLKDYKKDDLIKLAKINKIEVPEKAKVEDLLLLLNGPEIEEEIEETEPVVKTVVDPVITKVDEEK